MIQFTYWNPLLWHTSPPFSHPRLHPPLTPVTSPPPHLRLLTPPTFTSLSGACTSALISPIYPLPLHLHPILHLPLLTNRLHPPTHMFATLTALYCLNSIQHLRGETVVWSEWLCNLTGGGGV